ncbi:Protein FAR1-RELATED SEQUENCE 5 [Glycine soja]
MNLFGSRDEVLQWTRSLAHDIGFVDVIMRSDTNTGVRGRDSFLLIACERSGEYMPKKHNLVRTCTGSRKCGCLFKLRAKPVSGGEGWMVKLICEIHNHEMTKSFVGHPYAGQLTKDVKNIVTDMTKSMVQPRNILLTLKEHNDNNYTTIKQIYNARHAYRSSIRGSNTEMQQLMMLLDRDQYVHWHRVKDDNVVRDLFWSHPDAVKLTNSCNLVFLIDSTYKTNSYKLSLLDIVGVTPTRMTFSVGFAYLEGEQIINDLFMRDDALLGVNVTDRDLSLMNAVKTVFPDCTNLLCRFHIDKNVKAKCKTLVTQKNAWDYVMEAWGTLVDCPNESSFDEYLKNFEMACSPWPMFVDYVCQTWMVPHKERFVKAWANKVMHLENTTTNRVESAHWLLKRLLQNVVGDICSVWETMNNMMTLQHTQIKASFETSTHMVGHVFKVTLYALNEIATEYERVAYAGKTPSQCGCVMRSTHGLPCACELFKYVGSSIPLERVHIFWRSFSYQGLSETQVTITEEMETISKRFEQLDVYGKIHLKSKLRDIAYPDMNSMCPSPEKVKTKGAPKKSLARHQNNSSMKRSASTSQEPTQRRNVPMLNQFHPCMHDSVEKIIDVNANGNCGYRAIAALIGMGEESWSLADEYINLVGGIERFEELRRSLVVEELSTVTREKWMNITDMGYVIVLRYNVIVVSLSCQQSMKFFPLRSQPPPDSSVHCVICIGHVYENHFVQAKQWPTPYIDRMQRYTSLFRLNSEFVDLSEP